MTLGDKVKAAVDKITPGGTTTRAGGYGTTGTAGTTTAYEAGLGTPGAGTAGYGTSGYGTTGAGTAYEATGAVAGTERVTKEAAAAEAAATGRPAVAQIVTSAEAAPQRAPAAAEVCGQEFFTKTEDRPVVTERVQYVKEHRPVEKEYVVETRATGAEHEMGRTQEHLGTQERVVSEAGPTAPCE